MDQCPFSFGRGASDDNGGDVCGDSDAARSAGCGIWGDIDSTNGATGGLRGDNGAAFGPGHDVRDDDFQALWRWFLRVRRRKCNRRNRHQCIS